MKYESKSDAKIYKEWQTNNGAPITFVEAYCTFSGDVTGKMSTAKGNIGKPMIVVIVEAYETLFARCEFNFYA